MTIQWRLLAGAAVCIGTALTPLQATASCISPPEGKCHYDSPTDNSHPGAFYWTDHTGSAAGLPQLSPWCPTGVCNQFQARISNRKEDWNPGDWTGLDCSDPGPTVLFLAGAQMNNYPSEADIDLDNESNDPPNGTRLLQEKLFDAGARILEIRYRCPMLDSEVDFYDGTMACQHTFLNTVLNFLKAVNITEHPPGESAVPTTEKWWPATPSCRFGHGVSEGELQLQFAIDVLDDPGVGDVGIMNRVLLEGGGTTYDIRGTIDCGDEGDDLLPGCAWEENDSCKNLEQAAFWFSGVETEIVDACGGCWNGCEGHANNCGTPNIPSKECYQTETEDILDENSIHPYIGDDAPGQDDNERILGGLVMTTGQDHGVNEEANKAYLERHAVLRKALWQFRECQCTCSFWAHGTINRVYELLKNVTLPGGLETPIDDWKQFFLTGDLTLHLDTTPGSNPIDLPCPQPPFTVQCDLVEPPQAIQHPDDCS